MVDQSLIDYIKDGLKKGYKRPELEKILKENGWANLEISEAFQSLDKKGDRPQSTGPVDPILLNFINGALAKGINESKIRQALMAKNWPKEKIDSAFEKANRPSMKTQEVSIQREEKQKDITQQKGNFNYKKLLIYTGIFFLIFAILSLSLGVFFYIQAMVGYTIIDPNTGDKLNGYCLQENCQDMKDYIYTQVGNNSVLIFTIAGALALTLVLLHAFIPGKEKLIWISNIVFFLFICYMLFMWLVANNV